jgi:hypothetical protein
LANAEEIILPTVPGSAGVPPAVFGVSPNTSSQNSRTTKREVRHGTRRTATETAALPQSVRRLARKSVGFFQVVYFFFAFGFVLAFSSKAAWAAARRAMGTRKGEQLT